MQQLKGFVVEAAFPSDAVRQGDHGFGIVSRCRSLVCQAGQDMYCLVSPACTVALQFLGGVGLLECPQVSL